MKNCNQIYSTKDYSMFKILDKQNREIKKNHLSKLVKSIMFKNLLKDFPIVVSKELEVYDGQYRLKAAEKLNLDVYYKTTDKMVIDDIPLINSVALHWTNMEYLVKYVDQGNSNYIKFLKLLTEFKEFGFGVLFALCADSAVGSGLTQGGFGSLGAMFKRGLFVYPEDDSNIRETISKVKSFSPYIKIENSFTCAVVNIIGKNSRYDHVRMMDKMSKYGGMLKPQPNAELFATNLNEIYNYKVTDKAYILLRYKK